MGSNAELLLPLVQWWMQKERCPSLERHQPGPVSFLGGVGEELFFFLLKEGTLHEFVCHPCMGAVLIFSVSVQF